MNTYLLLGRTGDICSVLPFLKAEPEKPRLVVSNQHSSVLHGVSYVEVAEWNAGIHLLKDAYQWAKAQFGQVKCLQVIGDKDVIKEISVPVNPKTPRTTSFVKDMWRCAGQLHRWDEVLPLVFDKRVAYRETTLLEKHCPKKPGRPKKLMLVFTKSHSSPFPYLPLLTRILEDKFTRSHNIVFDPHAEEIFDLLALYEKAHTVICVDSAPLHLTRAVPTTPVFALVNDSPSLWNGSPWMPHYAWYCRYKQFPNRAMEMVDCIEWLPETWAPNGTTEIVTVRPRTYVNAVPWSEISLLEGSTGSDSATVLGDAQRYPFLKDCLRMGLQRARESDFVCLTRESVRLIREAPLTMHDASFAYRIEDADGKLTYKPVGDLFCARKSWWRERLNEIPNYVFGKDHYWSQGLWALFKKHKAHDATGICITTSNKA